MSSDHTINSMQARVADLANRIGTGESYGAWPPGKVEQAKAAFKAAFGDEKGEAQSAAKGNTVPDARPDERAAQAHAQALARAQALHKAVAAIYFDDSSDFRAVLWDIVHTLDPAVHSLLERDPRKAWESTDTSNPDFVPPVA